jgi:hypothetical protein
MEQSLAMDIENELEVTKKALELACQRICFHGHDCSAESVAGLNWIEFGCRDGCDLDGKKPFACWMKYFAEQAKSS